MSEESSDEGREIFEGPQSGLEARYIEDYLKTRGYRPEDLRGLPKEEARILMIEAGRYATARLAEHEARAKFRKDIRYD
jgi:hypothetical protein